MRAVTIQSFGDPTGMGLVELAEPDPGDGEVIIRTDAIGVGGVDAVIRRGTLGGFGFREGLIPGSEVAGIVIEVGTGVEPSWLGQRVWAFTGTGGAYSEQAVARVENLVPLPAALGSVEAVTLGSAAPVAHFALAQARLVAGESVLVRGAAGSIGIAAVELAAGMGAATIAVTSSSEERGDRLRALGATRVLDRAGEDGGPAAEFDVILDVVAGPLTPSFIGRLGANGRMIQVGVIAGFPPADFGTALLAGFQRSISFGTFSLDTVDRAELARVRREQFDAAVRGELHPVVHAILPLERAVEAHQRIDAGEVFGRIVLTP